MSTREKVRLAVARAIRHLHEGQKTGTLALADAAISAHLEALKAEGLVVVKVVESLADLPTTWDDTPWN